MRTKRQAWYSTGIGRYAEQLIRSGLLDSEVLDRVSKRYEEAGTKLASIRWYRSRLRRSEPGVSTNREARRNHEWRELAKGWSDPMHDGAAADKPHADEAADEEAEHEASPADPPAPGPVVPPEDAGGRR